MANKVNINKEASKASIEKLRSAANLSIDAIDYAVHVADAYTDLKSFSNFFEGHAKIKDALMYLSSMVEGDANALDLCVDNMFTLDKDMGAGWIYDSKTEYKSGKDYDIDKTKSEDLKTESRAEYKVTKATLAVSEFAIGWVAGDAAFDIAGAALKPVFKVAMKTPAGKTAAKVLGNAATKVKGKVFGLSEKALTKLAAKTKSPILKKLSEAFGGKATFLEAGALVRSKITTKVGSTKLGAKILGGESKIGAKSAVTEVRNKIFGKTEAKAASTGGKILKGTGSHADELGKGIKTIDKAEDVSKGVKGVKTADRVADTEKGIKGINEARTAERAGSEARTAEHAGSDVRNAETAGKEAAENAGKDAGQFDSYKGHEQKFKEEQAYKDSVNGLKDEPGPPRHETLDEYKERRDSVKELIDETEAPRHKTYEQYKEEMAAKAEHPQASEPTRVVENETSTTQIYDEDYMRRREALDRELGGDGPAQHTDYETWKANRDSVEGLKGETEVPGPQSSVEQPRASERPVIKFNGEKAKAYEEMSPELEIGRDGKLRETWLEYKHDGYVEKMSADPERVQVLRTEAPDPLKFEYDYKDAHIDDAINDMKNWDNLSNDEKRMFIDKYNALSPDEKYALNGKLNDIDYAGKFTTSTPSHVDDIPKAEHPSISERSFTNSEPAPVKFNHQDEINPVGDVLDDMKNWDNLSDAEKRSFQDKFNALSPQQKARLYEEVDKIEQAKNATSHIDDISGAEQPRVYDERPVTKAEPDSVTDFNYNRSSVNSVDDVPNYDYAPRAQGSGGRMIFDDSVLVDGKVPQELIDREIRARGLKDGTIEIYSETQFKEKIARNMMDAPDIPATAERPVVKFNGEKARAYEEMPPELEIGRDGKLRETWYEYKHDGYVEKMSADPERVQVLRTEAPDPLRFEYDYKDAHIDDAINDMKNWDNLSNDEKRVFIDKYNALPPDEKYALNGKLNDIDYAGKLTSNTPSHVDDFSGVEQPNVYERRPVTKFDGDNTTDFGYNRSSGNNVEDALNFKYENKSSTPIEDVSSPHEPVRVADDSYGVHDDRVPDFGYDNVRDVNKVETQPVEIKDSPKIINQADNIASADNASSVVSEANDVVHPEVNSHKTTIADNTDDALDINRTISHADETPSVVNNVDDIPPSEVHHEIEKPNITDDFADEVTTSKPVAEEMPSANNPVNETPHSQVTDDFLDDASLTPHDSVTPDRPSSSVSSPAEEFADTLEDAVPENVHDGNLKTGDELERAVPDKIHNEEYRANDDLFPDDPSNSVHSSANIDVDNHSASPLQTHAPDTSNTLDDALFPDEDIAPTKSHADVNKPIDVKNPPESEQALPSDIFGETSHYNNDYVPLEDVTGGKSVPETIVNENGTTLRYNGHTQKYEGIYQGEKVEVQVDDILKNKDYVPDEFTNDKGIKIVKQGTNNYSAVDVKTNRVVDEFPWSKAKEEYDALAKTNRVAPDTFRHEASGDTFVLDKNDNSYLRYHNGETVDKISSYDAERLYNAQFPNQAPDHFIEPERSVAYNLMEDGKYYEVTFADGRVQTVPTAEIDTYFNENSRLFETNLADPDKYLDHNYINAEKERKKAELEEYLANGGLPLVF